jgi:hypothetical protein
MNQSGSAGAGRSSASSAVAWALIRTRVASRGVRFAYLQFDRDNVGGGALGSCDPNVWSVAG